MTKELSNLIHRHIKEKDVLEAGRVWDEILPHWDKDREDIIAMIFAIEEKRVEKLNKKRESNGCKERSIFDS